MVIQMLMGLAGEPEVTVGIEDPIEMHAMEEKHTASEVTELAEAEKNLQSHDQAQRTVSESDRNQTGPIKPR